MPVSASNHTGFQWRSVWRQTRQWPFLGSSPTSRKTRLWSCPEYVSETSLQQLLAVSLESLTAGSKADQPKATEAAETTLTKGLDNLFVASMWTRSWAPVMVSSTDIMTQVKMSANCTATLGTATVVFIYICWQQWWQKCISNGLYSIYKSHQLSLISREASFLVAHLV